jgi:hypothetical protein
LHPFCLYALASTPTNCIPSVYAFPLHVFCLQAFGWRSFVAGLLSEHVLLLLLLPQAFCLIVVCQGFIHWMPSVWMVSWGNPAAAHTPVFPSSASASAFPA